MSRIRIHDANFDAATRHVGLRYMHVPCDETACSLEEECIDGPEKVGDLATDEEQMVNEMLRVHAHFLKASPRHAPSGVTEPVYYEDELIATVTDWSRIFHSQYSCAYSYAVCIDFIAGPSP